MDKLIREKAWRAAVSKGMRRKPVADIASSSAIAANDKAGIQRQYAADVLLRHVDEQAATAPDALWGLPVTHRR